MEINGNFNTVSAKRARDLMGVTGELDKKANLSEFGKRGLNVLEYGAKMDGTNDSAATQAARTAVATSYTFGTIDVPPGRFAPGTPTGGPSTPVLWRLSGNTEANGSIIPFIGTDIVQSFLPNDGGWWVGQGATKESTNGLAKFRRDVTHSGGGDAGGVMQALRVETNIIGEPRSFQWAFTSTIHTQSHDPQGNDCAGYFQGWRNGTGTTPLWAGCFEARDNTKLNSSQTGPLLGLECGIFGSGIDDANARIAGDFVVGVNIGTPTSPPPQGEIFEAYAGVRVASVSNLKDLCWAKRGVAVESGIADSAFDASLAKFRSTPVALRTGQGSLIDFSNSNTLLFGYMNNYSLRYKKAGVDFYGINDDHSFYQPDLDFDPAANPSQGVTGDWGFRGDRLWRRTSSGWRSVQLT